MILPYDVTKNTVFADMQTASLLMDSVASGRKPSQQVCSASGFGKTAIAKQRLAKYGIVSENEFYRSLPPLPPVTLPGVTLPAHIAKSKPQTRQTGMQRAVNGLPPFEGAKKRLFVASRPKEPISLVRTLHLCSMLQVSALLFDDPGKIAGDEASCDILKTAFGVQRTVTYETPDITRNENWRISGHGGYNPFTPPPNFPIPEDLRWLWLANTNYTDPAVLSKLGDHFAPLVARGLNPFWIRDDAQHDYHDLFLYVHWLATEQNLLRSMGFPYDVSRKAVNFFVTHPQSLIDLCPRRLELLALAFAADMPPAALEAELNSMAPKIVRPKLQLPASWITVPDGVLLWPEQPFSKTKPTVEGEPPRRIRRREREYKRLHPQPTPEPDPPAASPDPDPDPDPPPAASQPVQAVPEPDPEPPPSEPDPAPTTVRPIPGAPPGAPIPPFPGTSPPEPSEKRRDSPHAAIDEVYDLPINNTICETVADVLRRYPLDQWDRDDFDRLTEGLEGRAEWQRPQCAAITERLFAFDTTDSHKLFCTEAEGVLEYREGRLEICSWEAIEQRIAPAVAEANKKRAEERRKQEGRDIIDMRLPPKRKLKAMQGLIDRLVELRPTIDELGQRAIAYIRSMTKDDPQFADCTTFQDYVRKAAEITMTRTQGTDDV